MKTQRTHVGEMVLDHRESPGAFGVGAGQILEAAIKKCCGCQRKIVLRPDRERKRHYCRKCDSFMCDDCHLTSTVTGEHTPFVKVFEKAYEAAVRGHQIIGVQRVRA